jgi:hypothetical protein
LSTTEVACSSLDRLITSGRVDAAEGDVHGYPPRMEALLSLRRRVIAVGRRLHACAFAAVAVHEFVRLRVELPRGNADMAPRAVLLRPPTRDSADGLSCAPAAHPIWRLATEPDGHRAGCA